MPVNDKDIILRYTIGQQNTQTLAEFNEDSKYLDFLWLAKLSILSFQKWFPDARLVVLYNGQEYDRFKEVFQDIEPNRELKVEFQNQCQMMSEGEIENPYESMYPIGVWWKWIPFRLDISKHEIAIDTDILCLEDPVTWREWMSGSTKIIVAPDRFEKIKVNTCGDFHSHPLLKGKKPANCGIVGQRAGYDYSERFFDITKEVRYGYTHDSMFITEQGAINLWIYSLEMEKVKHTILDFRRNAWFRDFLYFLRQGISVETVHAVSWHKGIAKNLKDVLERKIFDDDYSNEQFVLDIVDKSSGFGPSGQFVINQQIEPEFKGLELGSCAE